MIYNILSFLFVLPIIFIVIIDLKYFIIPNLYILWLIFVGICNIFIFKTYFNQVLGILFSFVIFLLLYLLFPKGIGFGDVKLAGAIGLFLGLKLTILAILLSFLSGAIVGLLLIALHKKSMKDPIPFGPFLAFGAITSLFFGEYIIDWYLNLFL